MMKTIVLKDIKIGENYSREEIGDVSELMRSINDHGLQQPLIVDNEDNLVAGFRRHLAMTNLGWADREVDVVITQSPTPSVINLVENLERKNLTFYEEAQAIRRLFPNYDIAQVSEALGRSVSWARLRIKLFELPQEVIDLVKSGKVSKYKIAIIINSKNPIESANKVLDKSFAEASAIAGYSVRPGKKDLQEALTYCLDNDHRGAMNALRYALGDITKQDLFEALEK